MKTKIKFLLPAENTNDADACILLGEFNNWDVTAGIHLKKQADGSMTAEVELVAGQDYQYRYLLSNGSWVNDDGEKTSSEMSGYSVENCIIRVPVPAKKIKEIKPGSSKPKTTKTKAAVKAKPLEEKDDLTKIEGIGKKIEALLHKSNVSSYSQLSKTSIKAIKEILNAAGSKFSMHDPGS